MEEEGEEGDEEGWGGLAREVGEGGEGGEKGGVRDRMGPIEPQEMDRVTGSEEII